MLVLNKLERLLTVCKVKNIDDIDLSKEFYFIGKTDEEISLVCETNDVPENTIEREDGWRGFRIQGILDFSLIGIPVSYTHLDVYKRQILDCGIVKETCSFSLFHS